MPSSLCGSVTAKRTFVIPHFCHCEAVIRNIQLTIKVPTAVAISSYKFPRWIMGLRRRSTPFRSSQWRLVVIAKRLQGTFNWQVTSNRCGNLIIRKTAFYSWDCFVPRNDSATFMGLPRFHCSSSQWPQFSLTLFNETRLYLHPHQ